MAGNLDRDAYFLLERVRATVREPALGVAPWKGRELVQLLSEVDRDSADAAAVYLSFLEGLRRHLLEADDAQDILFRRLLSHNLLVEPDLHALSPGTRDHLVHVTQVFLLGWLILNGTSVFAEAPVSWCPYGWKSETQEARHEKLNHSWLFASLLHDCAYSVELAGTLQGRESAVGAVFGDLYETGMPGALSGANLNEHLRGLWRRRSEATGHPTGLPQAILDKNADQVVRRDHAFVGAVAVERQASRWEVGRNEEILAAALAIACHNFQYLVDKNAPPTVTGNGGDGGGRSDAGAAGKTEINGWFSLSFEDEPLSALLHLCDELQEWSRERADEAVAHRTGLRRPKYAATRIVDLSFPDAHRLSLDVALHRQPALMGAGEAYERRLAMQEDRDTAQRTRRLARLFGRDQSERFQLSLRVRQAVGFVPCRCELRIRRTRQPRGLLEEFKQRLERQPLPAHVETVEVTAPGICDLSVGDGWADCRTYTDAPLRLALVLPGGRGKSTFLAALARTGLNGRQIVYMDELPGELVDLSQEVQALRANARGRVLLLIDHLDRLVEEEYFVFWLDQIRTLAEIKDLDIIVACRPEEHERFVKGSLQGFEDVKDGAGWVSECRGITRSLVSGRPRACELEEALSGDPNGAARTALAVFACGLRQSRASATPLPQGTLRIAGREIALLPADGRYRFVHDCVQDLFSASRLLHTLAGEDPPAAIRQLRELPRDVFRMLLELVNRDTDAGLATAEVRARARVGLAVGLLAETTTQQWLYDTGRLHQAREALDEYVRRVPARSVEEAVGRKLNGHTQYALGSLPRLRDERTRDQHLDYYKGAVASWTKAVAATESLWEDPSFQKDGLRWLLAFLADHLLFALIRIASVPDLAPVARELAGEMVGRVVSGASDVVASEPGWVGLLLRRYSSVRGPADVDGVWKALDDGLMARRRAEMGGADFHFLDVRRAHIACHVGLHLIDHAFVPGLKKENASGHPTDYERLRRAEEWFERSISRRERVLLRMEADRRAGARVPGEEFGTAAAGLADAAHQYRGVFESLLFMLRSPARRESILAELSDAARRMEEAWTRAQNALLAAERLPVVYLESVRFLAAGRAIRTALARSNRSARPSAAEIEGLMLAEAKDLVADLPAIAEGAMRAGTTTKQAQDLVDRLLEANPNIFVDLAEELAKLAGLARVKH